jgi:hypothetical protein
MRAGVRFVPEQAPALSAAAWREFWRSRGLRELRALLEVEWAPLAAAPDAGEASAFRIASLLGSRAPESALAEELGRIRRDELGVPADPREDDRVARRLSAWFADTRP